jgi:hypothetical protein
MDAADQSVIFCDGESGSRSYTIGNLMGAPGIAIAPEVGRYRWDVALVQLDPYEVIDVGFSRGFDVPVPTPTITPTPTPSVPFLALSGNIDLIEPQNEFEFPAAVEAVQFQWRWTQSQNCQYPLTGHGFELRIWPEGGDFIPLGAMGDALANQDAIFCDPNSGFFGYRVEAIRFAPGVLQQDGGRYLWDVALIDLNTLEPVLISGPRVFVLPSLGF